MPILPIVGRRRLKLRLFIIGIYVVLCVGGVTMVYPYLLMLGTSVCSMQDYDEYRLVPRYLYDDSSLWAKYAFELAVLPRLGYEFGTMGYEEDDPKWLTKHDLGPLPPLSDWLEGRDGTPTYEQASRTAEDYLAFLDDLPRFEQWHSVWFTLDKTRFDVYRMYQDWLRERYTLDEVSLKIGAAFKDWESVFPPADLIEQHSYWPEDSPANELWRTFKREALPAHYVMPQSLHHAWYYFIARQPYEQQADRNFETAAEYNAVFGGDVDRISDIRFPMLVSELPTDTTRALELRENFLREWLPITMVRLNAPQEAFRAYISEAYRSQDPDAPPLSYYNFVHKTEYTSWDQITLTPDPPAGNAARRDWVEFKYKQREDGSYYCDLDWIEIVSPEAKFQERLRERYQTISALNDAWGTHHDTFDVIAFPTAMTQMVSFVEHRSHIRWRFFTGNYVDVTNFIAGHGWALWNTLFLVVATIFATLTVNPMAAYALSRFRLKFTNQILLFLLATMAFPAEVAMIPQFLLIKNLGLLNTYWALILPGVANGFGIFLLKGFFDSLPPELYEAALIDGAGEMRIFWTITLPLCKPILAVIALGAFTAAYGSFMFAFLVCQDRDMWTLMVFLFEFQQTASVPLIMASLVVASIPTLIVFIFCQNIILRGIVVPSFK